ncbi:MAG: hypothetical protein V2I36_06210 [Desulfopila sp.]|jgi:hypothetical protein|nr:hypothetical protein [Desulfopila sp.]
MCESYTLKCCCGAHRAELFFGKMLLDETSVKQLFCPECSSTIEKLHSGMVWDNGWVLELKMDIISTYSSTFAVDGSELTAGWIFDSGYITWVGITPNDGEQRNREREKIQQLAQTDILAYIQAMREWGQEREKRFISEGWRKMQS